MDSPITKGLAGEVKVVRQVSINGDDRIYPNLKCLKLLSLSASIHVYVFMYTYSLKLFI